MSIEEDIENHDAKEDGVYLVQVFEKDKFIKHAIFSVFEKAKIWINDLPREFTCICAPFILDEPEAGDRKKDDLQ